MKSKQKAHNNDSLDGGASFLIFPPFFLNRCYFIGRSFFLLLTPAHRSSLLSLLLNRCTCSTSNRLPSYIGFYPFSMCRKSKPRMFVGVLHAKPTPVHPARPGPKKKERKKGERGRGFRPKNAYKSLHAACSLSPFLPSADRCVCFVCSAIQHHPPSLSYPYFAKHAPKTLLGTAPTPKTL